MHCYHYDVLDSDPMQAAGGCRRRAGQGNLLFPCLGATILALDPKVFAQVGGVSGERFRFFKSKTFHP